MGRSSQRTKGFGVNILRGSRSPLLADSEILALCRWGIRDGLYIIPLLGFTVVLPNLQRDLGLIFSGVRDRLFWQIPRYWPCVDGGLGMGFT